MFRASLKCIQLIAVATYRNLTEYGFELVLKPFIKDMNKLSMVNEKLCLNCCSLLNRQGYPVNVNGRPMKLVAAVLVMLADTLAAHAIGGFKMGVGFSLRKCRNCLAIQGTMDMEVCLAK